MKYYVIADEITVKGFSAFGIEGTVVSPSLKQVEEPSQVQFQDQMQLLAQAAFEKALELENLGALILSAPIAELLRPLLEAHIASGNFPQILVL